MNYAQVVQVLYAAADVLENTDGKRPVEQTLPPGELVPQGCIHVFEHQVQVSLAGSRTSARVAEVICHLHNMSLMTTTTYNAPLNQMSKMNGLLHVTCHCLLLMRAEGLLANTFATASSFAASVEG